MIRIIVDPIIEKLKYIEEEKFKEIKLKLESKKEELEKITNEKDFILALKSLEAILKNNLLNTSKTVIPLRDQLEKYLTNLEQLFVQAF